MIAFLDIFFSISKNKKIIMHISGIVAMAENFVIGSNNKLPWHLPADLQHFKKLTMGKPILMGRKTYESIGKALPGRKNIILTHDKNFFVPDCVVVHSIDEAFAVAVPADEMFVIGGAVLFEQMLPLIERLYLTMIHQEFVGDAFFPRLDPSCWIELGRENCLPDLVNQYAYSFITLQKKGQ